MTDEMLPTSDEFDFSKDSTVETIEGVWTITSVNRDRKESEKGIGEQLTLEFQSEALPFPVTVRQFISYEYKNGGDTAWVKRSRGVVKNIVKAALGEAVGGYSALVGRQIRATTKDDGNGFYTLTKFRSADVAAPASA